MLSTLRVLINYLVPFLAHELVYIPTYRTESIFNIHGFIEYNNGGYARNSYNIASVQGRTKPFHARAGEQDARNGGVERARNKK